MSPLFPFRKPSFANSLILRGALLMLLALLVFAAGSYYFIVRPTVNGLADAQMRLVSQQLEARVSQLLQAVETTLRSSRGWGADGSLDHNQVTRFNEFFFPIIANHPEISSVNFAHESGREILLLRNADGSWVNRLSNPDRWGKRTYWLFWSTTHELQRVEMRNLDYDTRKRPWHRGAMALQDDTTIFWTEPYIFFTTKDPGITAAMRWTAGDGSRYVIGHDVRLFDLATFTAALMIGQAGRAALLQADGKLLAPPRDARFDSVDAIKATVLKTPAELGLRDIEQGFSAWQGNGSVANAIGDYRLDGRRWFSLFRPIAAGSQNFWLGVFAPEAEFLPADSSNLVALAGIALLALLAGIVVSIRIANRFGRPLVQLARESLRIGRLELDAPVVVDARWWEIRQLADAQETMRMRLKDANALLEAQVAERTAKLEGQFALVQALIDTIPNPIFYKGADTRFLGCNKAYEEAFGTSLRQFVGKRVLDLDYLPEAERQAYQAEDEAVVANFGRVAREITMRFADGQPHDTLYSVTGFANRDGTPGGLVGLIVDITPLKNAEREAQQARAAAEAAAAAKADFLANMSHEIRTPLNAIIGLTHIALQSDLTPRQRGYLEKVDTAGKSLLGIINDILDFSKIEAGKMSIETTDFSLGELLEQMADLTVDKANDKGLGLSFDCAPEIPDRLSGDPLRIRQVLLNLVGNALKFTDRGEVAVTVRRIASDGVNLRLRFEISDTGIGMDETQQQRLFSPFTQADTSTTRRFGGTGLGLSICKQLVGLMGGEIGVTSTPGQGSRFFFELPLGVVATDGTVPPRRHRQRDLIPEVLRGKRVLLVEDNEVNREMAEEILGAAGLLVTTSVNGSEAVEKASGGYHAILMDCNMPVMDGFEATRRIRANPACQGVPILAMTASVLLGDRELCQAAGMDDHVAKPIDVAELYAKLAKWISGPDAAAATRAPLAAVALPESPEPRVLDRATALARLAGNTNMYERLLARFREDQADAMTRIHAALAAGDRATATRHVHTVKGLAGNIGAEVLMQVAATTERALLAGEPADDLLATLGVELARVLATLDGRPLAEHTPVETPVVDARPTELTAGLARLLHLLRQDDAEAVPRLEELVPALGNLTDTEAVDRLARAVARYEFEPAVSLLLELAEKAGLKIDAGTASAKESP
jgi:two-component system, sensor histidine kinase and response regulator